MFEMGSLETTDKPKMYDLLARQARALLEGETDPVANAANLAALIFHQLPNLNWAGIYFLQDQELLVGPFQGRPACVRIPLGQGVCGSAAAARKRTANSGPLYAWFGSVSGANDRDVGGSGSPNASTGRAGRRR